MRLSLTSASADSVHAKAFRLERDSAQLRESTLTLQLWRHCSALGLRVTRRVVDRFGRC